MVELPGDFGLVESRFGPFGDCVNVVRLGTVLILTLDRCTVCA
jgi:hypothetical protein